MKAKKLPVVEYRHGENQIIRLDAPPDLADYVEEPRVNGALIVGHSETGAVHTVASPKAKLYRKAGAEIAYLLLGEPDELEHKGDRHKPGLIGAPATDDAITAPGWHAVVVTRQANEDESWSPVRD